mgnify:CR=1 FL=1
MRAFTELEMDALSEAFNLALGEAAATFASLVREEIELSAPTVEIISREALSTRLEKAQSDNHSNRLCSIDQRFHSADGFDSEALLLFPEQGSLEIVRRMLGDDTPIEHITELEQDALAEIGNIIINSCMSSLANLFGTEMLGSLPQVRTSSARALLDEHCPNNVFLVARIGMTMSAHNIAGYVLFIMDVPSIETFMRQVGRLFNLSETS